MSGYDLDYKKGLFARFNQITPSKFLSVGDFCELKHYNMFEKIKSKIVYFDDNTVRIQAEEEFDIMNISEIDHVVITIDAEKDKYKISGEIVAKDSFPPFKVDVRISAINSMKEMRKHKRFPVSERGKIKLLGDDSFKDVVVKNVSLGGVNLKVEDDLSLDSDLTMKIYSDKKTKFDFRGAIVRKKKVSEFGDYFEYGIEIIEITESNLLLLHRFMNSLEFN